MKKTTLLMYAWLFLACIGFMACEDSAQSDANAELAIQEKIEKVKQLYISHGWEIRTDVSDDSIRGYCDTVDIRTLARELEEFEGMMKKEMVFSESFSVKNNSTPLPPLLSRLPKNVTMKGSKSYHEGYFEGTFIIEWIGSDLTGSGYYNFVAAFAICTSSPHEQWKSGYSIPDKAHFICAPISQYGNYVLYRAEIPVKYKCIMGEFTFRFSGQFVHGMNAAPLSM